MFKIKVFMKSNQNILKNKKVLDWDEQIIADNNFQIWSILTCMSDMRYVHRIVLGKKSNIYLIPEKCLLDI